MMPLMHAMCRYNARLPSRGTDCSPRLQEGVRLRSVCCGVLWCCIGLWVDAVVSAAEWRVPLGGNAYLQTAGAGDGLHRGGAEVRWTDAATTYAVFFHVDRPATVRLGLESAATHGEAQIGASVAGKRFTAMLSGAEGMRGSFGAVAVPGAGYVEVTLRGLTREGSAFAREPVLVVESDTPELHVSAVTSNEGAMYYWGRRGPSVHLGYQTPAEIPIEYAYNELTVPLGEDAIGSFFMANGFGEGYFGIQVNGPDERRVLFSIWSPFNTDDPAKVPQADRVTLLRKGEGVQTGEFGNEGSGEQSFLVYPWKAGTTYRFLTRVEPAGDGTTTYTSWLGEGDLWRLIASFRRPKTDRHLTGFHSFLENFADTTGNIGRRGHYANQWVRAPSGTWYPIAAARFTGDATASGGHRLDYAGGIDGDGFFLRNCGYFSPSVKLGTVFTLDSPPATEPTIDFEALP